MVAAGVMSPLGAGLEATRQALREARDCISPVTRFSVAQCRCTTAGQVDDCWLAEVVPNDRKAQRLHRVSRMMIAALRELLAQAPDFRPELMVVGTTSGGMSFGEHYYRALQQSDAHARQVPSWIANYPPQKPAADALEACGLAPPAR